MIASSERGCCKLIFRILIDSYRTCFWKGMIALSPKLQDLNKLDKNDFVKETGFVFEDSPWIAEIAWSSRPFSSITELHQTMVNIVEGADRNKKLALVRAHPDLAAKVNMTPESVKEQSEAGLDQLSPQERQEFLAFNQAYTHKFEFPFIVAVKENTKDDIKTAMRERIANDRETELKTALQEIYKIARYRLEAISI